MELFHKQSTFIQFCRNAASPLHHRFIGNSRHLKRHQKTAKHTAHRPCPDICHNCVLIVRVDTVLHHNLQNHPAVDLQRGGGQLELEAVDPLNVGFHDVWKWSRRFVPLRPGQAGRKFFLFHLVRGPNRILSTVRTLLRLRGSTEKEPAVITSINHFNHRFPL